MTRLIFPLTVLAYWLAGWVLLAGAAGQEGARSSKPPAGAALLANLPAPSTAVRITRDGYFKQRPEWSPEGRRLVFARHRRDKIWLYVRDLATGRDQRLTQREHPEYDATWSPDGKHLAFCLVGVSGTQGDLDVYVIGADGSGLAPVVKSSGGLSQEEWPAWSPDGKRIALTSTRPGNQEVFVVNADGAKPRRLTRDPAIDAHPSWSPDGRRIAFATDRWGGREIAIMDADGSNVRRLTHSRGLDDYPAWSPDGELVAFVSNRDGNLEVYLMRPDGSEQTNLTRSGARETFPAWASDGRAVVFVSNRDGHFDLYVLGLDGPYDLSSSGDEPQGVR